MKKGFWFDIIAFTIFFIFYNVFVAMTMKHVLSIKNDPFIFGFFFISIIFYIYYIINKTRESSE